MTQKGPPADLVQQMPQRLREWLVGTHNDVGRLKNAVASASGELVGREDISTAIPADSTAATVADLRADLNALLAALRGL